MLIGQSHEILMRSPGKRLKLSDQKGQDPGDIEHERNFKLTRLSNIIGSHPAGMGPDTILSQLATLVRRLDTWSNLSEKEKMIL